MPTPFDSIAAASAARPVLAETHAAATPQDLLARWQLLIGAARLRWSKLTEAELHKTAGNDHQLAVLLQGRYRIPRGDAYRQVKGFHDDQKR
jgi:hypothetical protein